MYRDEELDDLVSFDPKQLIAAIKRCHEIVAEIDEKRERLLKRAQAYRALLILDGYSETRIAQETARGGEKQAASEPTRRFVESLEGMTIAEAVVRLISRSPNGKLHGKVIIAQLKDGGRPIGGENPMATLSRAMARDPRIENDGTGTNTWRLREARSQADQFFGVSEGGGRG